MDSTDGVIPTEQSGLTAQIATDNAKIATDQTNINTLQTNLANQMDAADAMIAEMQQQYSYVTGLFASMTSTRPRRDETASPASPRTGPPPGIGGSRLPARASGSAGVCQLVQIRRPEAARRWNTARDLLNGVIRITTTRRVQIAEELMRLRTVLTPICREVLSSMAVIG